MRWARVKDCIYHLHPRLVGCQYDDLAGTLSPDDWEFHGASQHQLIECNYFKFPHLQGNLLKYLPAFTLFLAARNDKYAGEL